MRIETIQARKLLLEAASCNYAKRGYLAKRLLERMQEATKGDVSDLGMVALFVPEDVAGRLRLRGGEEAEDMHVTLLFLGEVSKIANPDMVKAVIADVAQSYRPLTGQINGIGRFVQTHKEGYHVIYASPDLRALSGLRQDVVNHLSNHGIDSPSEHGFVPHITLTYVPEGTSTPDVLQKPIPVTFDAISVVIGGERTDYKFRGDM